METVCSCTPVVGQNMRVCPVTVTSNTTVAEARLLDVVQELMLQVVEDVEGVEGVVDVEDVVVVVGVVDAVAAVVKHLI